MRTTEQLVRCAQSGDPDAFAELLARFEGPALSTAYAILLNPEAARDAAQEGSMKAWQNLGTMKEPEKFGGWFCGIVRNAAIDQRRKSNPVPKVATDHIHNPAAMAEQKELFGQIHKTLQQLDESTRTIVMMRYFDDLPTKQIAALVDLSPGAVDMRLSRARQELRGLLAGAASGKGEMA